MTNISTTHRAGRGCSRARRWLRGRLYRNERRQIEYVRRLNSVILECIITKTSQQLTELVRAEVGLDVVVLDVG